MENELNEVAGYVQNEQGKWILTEEAKAESLAMYYSGRLAYDPQDLRHSIGRYTSTGAVVPFTTWPTTSLTVEV